MAARVGARALMSSFLYQFIEYNVGHRNTTLFFPATALKSGVYYIIRVKAEARLYNSTWSEWSPSIRWQNCEYPV